MAENQFKKYVVSKPIYEAGAGYKGRQSPTMTLLSNKQVPECNYLYRAGLDIRYTVAEPPYS